MHCYLYTSRQISNAIHMIWKTLTDEWTELGPADGLYTRNLVLVLRGNNLRRDPALSEPRR
jgi:hypothetical protein